MRAFLCGPCSWKNKLTLNERIEMSKRTLYKINICSDCGNEVVDKTKPIRPTEQIEQLRFFSGFADL